MTPTVTIIDAKRYHCGRIVRRLRADHVESCYLAGIDAHRQLSWIFDQSAIRRAAFFDAELVALGGVTGTLLAPTGVVWLALSHRATLYPTIALRHIRREMERIMAHKAEVVTTVITSDPAAMRLAAWLGFHVKHEGEGAPAMSRYGRRRLLHYLRAETDLHIQVGRTSAISMGLHALS